MSNEQAIRAGDRARIEEAHALLDQIRQELAPYTRTGLVATWLAEVEGVEASLVCLQDPATPHDRGTLIGYLGYPAVLLAEIRRLDEYIVKSKVVIIQASLF